MSLQSTGKKMTEKEVGGTYFPRREIEKEKQRWRSSPWNERKIPKDEPAPIMMCKRCRHPR